MHMVYQIQSQIKPDQSWLNTNQTDYIYAIKQAPGGSENELPAAT